MRPIAFYLPQYHEIEENNIWWGQGFTEWNSVKNGKPYFKNHYQPKIPINNNYYDLSDENADTWKWQASLAKKYGIYGFCIYHYWFKNEKKLLEKPAEILLAHNEVPLKYFFCWANEPWKRTWYSYNDELLMEQEYGNIREWKLHYEYLKQFFCDPRYIKIDNKPVIAIYKSSSIEYLEAMKKLWNEFAINDGFNGIHIMSGETSFTREDRFDQIDSMYRFEPAFTLHYCIPKYRRIFSYIRRRIVQYTNRFSRKKKIEDVENMKLLYKYLPHEFETNKTKIYPGICPSWDNTPRKKWKGSFFKYSSPNLFERKLKYFNERLEKDDFIFINAWNEWSEGAYLEPDTKNGFKYLEAVKKTMSNI